MNALFDGAPYVPQTEPLDARAVGCPRCGALPGRPCRSMHAPEPWRPPAHAARIAQARFAAGLADTPTPTLFQEER